MGQQQMFDLWMHSWRTYTAVTAASLDSLLSMQKSLLNLSSITLSDGFDHTDENYMREAFQRAADANVRRWSDTADMLKGMPEWMRTMNAMPGTTLTNLFDKAQRARG